MNDRNDPRNKEDPQIPSNIKEMDITTSLILEVLRSIMIAPINKITGAILSNSCFAPLINVNIHYPQLPIEMMST